jgi:hypothetical protein
MITTTLDPSFLRSVVAMTMFTPKRMLRCQAALLMVGLGGGEFNATALPGELTEGNKHVAGAATGSLVATGLLTVTGRIKSPLANAKGRKLDTLRLTSIETAKTWLRANKFAIPEINSRQLNFL